jgi:4-hydroxybenzoate polyprenyltransferase
MANSTNLIKKGHTSSPAIPARNSQRLLNILSYEIRTLTLFTFSDWKAIIVPQALLAFSNAKSGKFSLDGNLQSEAPSWGSVLACMPLAIFWLWLTTLVQDVANQRLLGSIQEDRINKPWRPLPAGRISAGTASNLLFYAIISALGFSTYLGATVLEACALLICVVWLYNDLDGSNSSPFMRNALIACGHVAFGIGATAVATTSQSSSTNSTGSFSTEATKWFGIVWLAIFCTSHGQDFADMEGDQARGRLTMPLLYGEYTARWMLSVSTLFWSLAAPRFWHSTGVATSVTGRVVETSLLATGLIMSGLVLIQTSKQGNKRVLKLWCLWIAALFMLPLTSD